MCMASLPCLFHTASFPNTDHPPLAPSVICLTCSFSRLVKKKVASRKMQQKHSQNTTEENRKEHCTLMAQRWVSEHKLISTGKRGEEELRDWGTGQREWVCSSGGESQGHWVRWQWYQCIAGSSWATDFFRLLDQATCFPHTSFWVLLKTVAWYWPGAV